MKKIWMVIVTVALLLINSQVWATCEGVECDVDTGQGTWLDISADAWKEASDFTDIGEGKDYGAAAGFWGNAGGHSAMVAEGDDIKADVSAQGGVLGFSKSFELDGVEGVGSISQVIGTAGAGWSIDETSDGLFSGHMSLNMDLTNSAASHYGGDWNQSETFGLATHEVCARGGLGISNYDNHGGGHEMDLFVNADSVVYSHSYGYTEENDGKTTIARGSLVNSTLSIESGASDIPHCYEGSIGGWEAAGGAVTESYQSGDGGYANALAVGAHSASGEIGQNYSAETTGYSRTYMTSFEDMVGGINRAESGMHVSSKLSE